MQLLAVISTRLNLESGKVHGALRTAGFSIPSLDSSLENIASENQISPKDLYALIQEIESFKEESLTPPLQKEKQDFTEQKGFGRLNLQEALQELREPLSEVMAYAKKTGYPSKGRIPGEGPCGFDEPDADGIFRPSSSWERNPL